LFQNLINDGEKGIIFALGKGKSQTNPKSPHPTSPRGGEGK
jgi:hypothetical protein